MISSQHLISFFEKHPPHNSDERFLSTMLLDWTFDFEDGSRITVMFRADLSLKRCSFTLMNTDFMYLHLFKILPQRKFDFDYAYPSGTVDIFLSGGNRMPYPIHEDVPPHLEVQKNKHRKRVEALLVRFVLELC